MVQIGASHGYHLVKLVFKAYLFNFLKFAAKCRSMF